LRAEVEKGFARTAFDRESVDPKAQINLVNKTIADGCSGQAGSAGSVAQSVHRRRKSAVKSGEIERAWRVRHHS